MGPCCGLLLDSFFRAHYLVHHAHFVHLGVANLGAHEISDWVCTLGTRSSGPMLLSLAGAGAWGVEEILQHDCVLAGIH